jgi:hypothetical protein
MQRIVYAIFLFLAVYNAGNMLTLQIQHYGIYRYIGKDSFKKYMKANNISAVIPSIIPAMILLMINVVLLFYRPLFMSFMMSVICLCLNVVALISTFKWQRKLQGDMVIAGYDENKIRLLCSTNWIRTVVFMLQAVIAVTIIINTV